MPEIFTLTNSFLSSNTYVIDAGSDCEIVVDPGDPDISGLTEYLKLRNKKYLKVFLTHEHADHCAGLNPLYSYREFELFCTRVVADRIADRKLNLSMYFGNIQAFEVRLPVKIIGDNEIIRINGFDFTFIETPGHSPGGTCIFIDQQVFTGDTILNNIRTPLNLPGNNKEQYQKSLLRFKQYVKEGMTIYPGHGLPFTWGCY